jgi:hypothetical protein
MVRLFRIIGSSDPEGKLKTAPGLIPARGGPSLPGSVRYRGYLPIWLLHRPPSLQLCHSQPAQKTFRGGVFLTGLPQCGLECSHPALPDREITQVNQQSDRLVVFVGLPLLDVRCNLIPSRVLALP